ncbi:hypothetical protein [Vibrio sp. MA40-2]|uniref:hypothetical protein n=1 Tax=Vibrio sp. MA40-2 TaxID=3391828 RepID=UPI0039A6ED70
MALLGIGLQFDFKTQNLTEDSFDMVDFCFVESLSNPFETKLTLANHSNQCTDAKESICQKQPD